MSKVYRSFLALLLMGRGLRRFLFDTCIDQAAPSTVAGETRFRSRPFAKTLRAARASRRYSSEARSAEAKGVGDYGDGAEGHGGAGDDGAEEEAEERIENARGNGHADGIVGEGEEKVLADVAHGGAAKRAGANDAAQIASKESDSGAFDGDVGSRPHGDSDVGLRQSGRVVDAVTGHGNDVAFGLQPFDDFRFLAGLDFRFDAFDAEFLRDGFRHALAIAREHHDAQTLLVQRFEGFGGRLLDGIGDGDESGGFAVYGDEDHALAFRFERLCARIEIAQRDAKLLEKGAIAQGGLPGVHRAGDASTGTVVEVGEIGSGDLLFLRRRQNGAGERVLAGALEAGGDAQDG